MNYRGYIDGGIIRPREPIDLPDGTEVEFTPVNGSRDELDAASEAFWRNRPVDEIMREQNILPIRDLNELAGEWPADDDIEEFLRFLKRVRQ